MIFFFLLVIFKVDVKGNEFLIFICKLDNLNDSLQFRFQLLNYLHSYLTNREREEEAKREKARLDAERRRQEELEREMQRQREVEAQREQERKRQEEMREQARK